MATNYLKPQEPLKKINKTTGDTNYLYPLVTSDQVILENGNRLNVALTNTQEAIDNLNALVGDTAVSEQIDDAILDLGAITIDIEGATEGTPATIDADTFNGYTIDNFVMYNTDDGESDYMAKSVYDTDSDGVVDNAAKLGGHGADYFSSWRDCSNVPFNEIAAGKGVFLVNWSSANSPNANTLLGISDGWTAIAMSYTGEIYITTIEKTAWEVMSVSKSGGTFTGDAVHFNNYRANVGSWYGSNTDHNAHLATVGEDGLISQIAITDKMEAILQQWKDGQYIKGAKVMTDAGGTFTGEVYARADNRNANCVRNNVVKKSDGSANVSTGSIIFIRK